MKVTETLPTCCESIIGDVGVIDGILDRYDPISLQEMKKVRLMNRVDTKYVTTKSVLARLLSMANSEYMVQTIDSRTNIDHPFDYAAFKEEQYDKLANLVRKHVDMDYIYRQLV